MYISIIIPMYNEERYITRCLDSLQKQTYQDFEIILIDDGSTDRTIEKASAYPAKILKQEHGGPGKARNWWAKETKGEILIFVDADMYFDENFIENLIQPILKGEEIGTAHGTELVGNLENPLARAWGIIRWKYDKDNPRSWIYRAIFKSVFLDFWWFDGGKWYFDDDLSKINNGGLWALAVENAICYHNNPEKISEWYKHSIWVGKWLIQSWQIKEYWNKYKLWILTFLLSTLMGLVVSIYLQRISFFFLLIVISILILIYIKTIQRTIKEWYLSHLFFIPVVIMTRWTGYVVWACKFIIFKK